MNALRERMESDLDVIMVGTWMLCGNGWSVIFTLSWLAHGCSVRSDGVGTAHLSGVDLGSEMAARHSDGAPDGVGVRRNVWLEG